MIKPHVNFHHPTIAISQWWTDLCEKDDLLLWHWEWDLVLITMALQNECTLPQCMPRILNLASKKEVLDFLSDYLISEGRYIQFVGTFLLSQYCHSKRKRQMGSGLLYFISKCGIVRDTTSFTQCPCFQGPAVGFLAPCHRVVALRQSLMVLFFSA